MRFTRRQRWLTVGLIVVLAMVVAGVIAYAKLPGIVRMAAIAALRASTHRDVSIDAVHVNPSTGELAVQGFRVIDHDGGVLAEFERLEARIHRRSLLRGHLWLDYLTLVNSNVRVVRFRSGEFNISDLLRGQGASGTKALDVTVDHFRLSNSTVVFEDRLLSPWKTWRSERLEIEAKNVSTTHGGGTAVASSVLEGAPVSVRVDDLRLLPAHLRAVVTVQGADVGLARLYLPASAPVTIEGGRLAATVNMTHDARQGTHLDVAADLSDLSLIRRVGQAPVAGAPALRLTIKDLGVSPGGAFTVEQVALTGSGTVFDASVSPPARFDLSAIRLQAEALTWPVTSPARVDVAMTVPGNGRLTAR